MALQQGSSGPDVQTIQMQLNKFGYGLTTDGLFGPATRQAVMNFQSQHGLHATGVVDDPTEQLLAGGTLLVSPALSTPGVPSKPPTSMMDQLYKPGITGYPFWMEAVSAIALVWISFKVMRS